MVQAHASPKITKLNFRNTPVILEISPRCAAELPKEVPRKVTVIPRHRTRCCRTPVVFYGEMYDEVYSWRSSSPFFCFFYAAAACSLPARGDTRLLRARTTKLPRATFCRTRSRSISPESKAQAPALG